MRGHFSSSRMSTRQPQPRLARPIAFVLVVSALAIPTSAGATYGFVSDQGSVPGKETTGSGQLVAPDHSALDASLAPTEGSTAPTVVAATSFTDGDGFDWADAALGAGITMALAALAGGAVLALRRQPDASDVEG